MFAERMDAQSITLALGGRWRGRSGNACCPAHEDRHPSLSISEGDGGKVLVHCHTGCDQDAVIEALRDRHLWPENQPTPQLRVRRSSSENGVHYDVPTRPEPLHEVAVYDYRDEHGRLLFQALRYENPKTFKQRQVLEGGSFVWNLDGVRRIPYRLPELLSAPADAVVYVPEGEKDVDRLISQGLVATCNPMGAGKWLPEFAEYLRGHPVVVLPDNDDAGRNHGDDIRSSLIGVASSARTVILPGLAPGGDVSDWLDSGHTVDELVTIVNGEREPRLRFLTAEELLLGDPVPVPWLIHAPPADDGIVPGGLLAAGDTGIVGAASGTGKTWVGAEISFSLATATMLFDAFDVVRPCRVMIVDEESSGWLLRKRWLQILKGHEIDPREFVDLYFPNLRVYVDNGFSFDNDRTLEALYEEAEEFRPDVVLFDTLARVHRRPENDNSEIAALFEDRIKPFKRQFGCALMFMHHLRKPSKDAPNDPASMLRGAGDLKGQLDQFWFLRGRSGESRAIFEHDKCRAMPELKPFVIERVDTANGGVRVLKVGDAVAAGATAAEQHQDVLLTFLVDVGRATRQELVDFGKTRAIGRANVDYAIKALLDDGQVDRARVGHEVEYFPSEID